MTSSLGVVNDKKIIYDLFLLVMTVLCACENDHELAERASRFRKLDRNPQMYLARRP